MADLFDNIKEWLLDQALGENDISTIVQEMAERLQNGGIPISRISMGRPALHPVIALIDMQWNSDTGRVTIDTVARKTITPEWLDTVKNSPFGEMTGGQKTRIVADLRNPEDVKRYDIFKRFADEGLTGYVAYFRSFGREQDIWSSMEMYLRGAAVSFSTKRFSGFSAADIEGLERLVSALCICARVDGDRFLAHEVLQAYLGRISSKQVLSGRVSRGDGNEIDCAILYSDLCGSVALSQQLDTSAYLDTVNAYFDCTINAVTDHGGEVLKLIGDGVLAIFPFEANERPRDSMCAAALASAKEAFMRAKHLNVSRTQAGLPEIDFGVALHVGKVIYGNVGTEKRIDFTATGPAVGMAARVEALTRDVGHPLLATQDFADLCPEPGIEVGDKTLKDFKAPVTLLRYEV